MTRRLFIPVILILCFCTGAMAQNPGAVQVEATTSTVPGFSSVVCPPGVTAFAGTSTQALAPTAQSNDVEFLCLGDILNITHQGGQTFGDPDPSTAPGISYGLYTCAPTVTGPDFASVNADPCLLNNPPAPGGGFYVDQTSDINGNSSFNNSGFLQNNYNGGDPLELFFAPVTLDNFSIFTFENDNMGGPSGPCINANTNDAFRVVYLNEIEGTNINIAAQGTCTASFTVLGGLSEFDNSPYTNITITSNSNPSATGMLTTFGNVTHGDVVTFSVPEPGIYNVVIEDGKSCSASFDVDMTGCIVVESIAGDVTTDPGGSVCVPITASGFNDILNFQYIIDYDPAVIAFSSVNAVGLPDDLQSANPTPGEITISWLDATFIGQTFAPNDILFEVCFTAIGALGTSSDIIFTGDAMTSIEFTDANGFALGSSFNNGSVSITTSAFTLDFAVCTSLMGNMDGSFTVSAIGAVDPVNFDWVLNSNPGVSGSGTIPDGVVNNLNPGTYEVEVTDGSGNTVTSSVVIPDLAPLFVQTFPTNPTCPNGTDGCMEANFGAGVAPYTVEWNIPGGGGGMSTICNLGAADYEVTVTDDLGCILTSSNSLQTQELELTLLDEQDQTCGINGFNLGLLSVEATGSNPPFTYLWSNGETTPTITDLQAGNYTITATDLNGCSIVESFIIDLPNLPTIISWDSVTVACPTDMTGALTVNVQPGGAAISTYQWDDPNNQNTQTATMLTAGTYSVTVTDDVGCSVVGTESLFAPDPLSATANVTAPACPSFNTGVISLAVTGGAGPNFYNYQWSTGSTLSTIAGLVCDSIYTVTITDGSNCDPFILAVDIPCPDAIVVDIDQTSLEQVSCFNDIVNGVPCDGNATAFASGGTVGNGNYTFTWSSGESFSGTSTSSAAQLCKGEQFVIVSDANCPADTAFFTIGSPSELLVDLNALDDQDPSCFGLSDGSVTIGATGGQSGYTFEWSNPPNPNVFGATLSNIPAGNYNVTITDANNCTIATSINLSEPDPFMVLVADDQTTDTVTCAGGADGQISVFPQGGNPGLNTYQWTPNTSDNAATATGLSAGTYSVTVTDPQGCSDETQVTIEEPSPVGAIIPDPVEPLCFGDQTVVTIDSAFGGSSASHTFSVDFGPPQFITSSIPILAGEHTIQVFDADGCFTEYNINVGEPNPVIVDLEDRVIIELGDSIQLQPIIIAVDVPIDTLFWDPNDNLTCISTLNDTICKNPWVAPLETTVYELMVVDTNGCVGVDEIIVEIDRNRNVYIPNAFSPDGNGINDLLKVYTGVGVDRVNYFRIFDRWGEQVYARENFTPGDNDLEGWDGRFNNKDMNSGTYVYIAEVIFVDGRVLLYRGDIALIR